MSRVLFRTFLLASLGGLTLLAAYLSASHCCDRLNLLAAFGLAEPGCIGLGRYRTEFVVTTFLCWTAMMGLALFGPGAKREWGWLGTGAMTAISVGAGLLMFVLP